MSELGGELLERRHLAEAGGDLADRRDLAALLVEFEFRRDDTAGRHDSVQRRDDYVPRRRRDDMEGCRDAVDAVREQRDELRDGALQAYPPAGLDQVLTAHAAKIRVVPDEVGELAALLHEIAGREALHALLVIGDPDEFGQHETGVVETQRLIEIRREQIALRFRDRHDQYLLVLCP